MNTKELLLSKRWILKREDRDSYYRIKDQAKYLQNLFQDKLGYSLISNQNFIKIDKVPGKAEPWMGITEFQHVKEYQIFCYVLIFLEDKDSEEQFILSNLVEFIQVHLQVSDDFWLVFTNRKLLVNVLKVCIKEQLLLQNDGSADTFAQNQETEVLFESTGLSRHFMRNFVSNIFDWKEPSDFMNNERMGLEQDRGIIRKHRIYRRLLLSCGIYQENSENDDFAFIKNYRRRIENDFNDIFPCQLQVYRTSAFLKLEEEVKIGQVFPKTNALDELVILLCTKIATHIKKGRHTLDENEIVVLTNTQIFTYIEEVITENKKYLPATYRQKKIELLRNEVFTRIKAIGFIEEFEEQCLLYPGIAKIEGSFFIGGEK